MTDTNTDTTHGRPLVTFSIDDDEHATRISRVLTALDYDSTRVGAFDTKAAWAHSELVKRYGLSSRESEIVQGVLDGLSREDIASMLEVSRATVKWHMHNIFAKTNTGNREALLRLAVMA